MRLIIAILLMISAQLVQAGKVDITWNAVNKTMAEEPIVVDTYKLYCTSGEIITNGMGNITDSDGVTAPIQLSEDVKAAMLLDSNLRGYTAYLERGEHSCNLTAVYQGVESQHTIDYPFTVPDSIPNMPEGVKIDVNVIVKISIE